MELTTVTYNGKTSKVQHHIELSDEKFAELKEAYYAKPDFNDVRKEIINGLRGGTKNSNITNYYFKDLMAKTKIYFNKWSIEEVFESKDLLGIFYGRIKNQNMHIESNASEIRKIETAIRLGGRGIASKPANFPIKTVDQVLQKYNVNGNYYDYSCGWGARLFSAMKNNVNYYGTDPNHILIERLQQFANDFKDNCGLFVPKVSLRNTGSEVLHEDMIDKIGLAFSSPPYFFLEDYKIGKQSANENTTYDEWKSNYLIPTIQNIHKYLINDGYFLFNIKGYKKYNLLEDSLNIITNNGFEFIKYEELSNIRRPNDVDSDEKIMVFMKKGEIE